MNTEDMTQAQDYRSGETLGALLRRLHEAGDGAWTHNPVAAELMQFTCEKYANLARKHELDPWEAVTAAFHVMRTRAAREACNPWGVITHAVRITCIYEKRAQGPSAPCTKPGVRMSRPTMIRSGSAAVSIQSATTTRS